MIFVSILIYEGRAYLPTQVYMNSAFSAADPVYVSKLDVNNLAGKIDILVHEGNPTVESRSVDERKNRSSVVLRATGAKSWKAMARTGAAYSLFWMNERIVYTASMLDKKGRWIDDPKKTVDLAADTPIAELAQMILDDWSSRSEPQ